MQANEPTSEEYDSVVIDACSIIHRVEVDITQFTKYMRRMYEYSEVDNSFLADALENMTRSLANLGSDVERVRLHALSCETEAKLREEEAQQNHPVKDKENEE